MVDDPQLTSTKANKKSKRTKKPRAKFPSDIKKPIEIKSFVGWLGIDFSVKAKKEYSEGGFKKLMACLEYYEIPVSRSDKWLVFELAPGRRAWPHDHYA